MADFGRVDFKDPTWYQKWRKEQQEAQQRLQEEKKRQEAEAKKTRELEAELDHEDDDAADDVQFEDYEPLWLKGIGKKHPDPVVENASLSAVKAPKPPDDCLEDIASNVVSEGKLSNLQLEAVAYANMCFGKNLEDGSRRGFFIGDGAGIGKGRELAGIVAQQWARGVRKHLWISVSNDLKFDAERDLRDLGSGNIPVQLLGKASYSAKDLPKQGVVFATYASLLGKKGGKTSKPQTRLDQLLEWASPGFEGGLLFDESHKAKNLFGGNGGKPTKTGQAVLKLQTALPRARVVYCSATGASEPKHLGYMDRLGLWGGSDTPFGDFDDFRRAVESRGVGMMELVAMHLKQRGALVSRALSFKSCTFELVNDVMTPSLCGVLVLSRRRRRRGTTSLHHTQAHGARLRPFSRSLGLAPTVFSGRFRVRRRARPVQEARRAFKKRHAERRVVALLLGRAPALLQGFMCGFKSSGGPASRASIVEGQEVCRDWIAVDGRG